MKIGVIGDPNFTTGFRLAGVEEFKEVRDDDKPSNLTDAVNDMMQQDEIGIVIMHMDDIQHLDRQTKQLINESIEPTVITLGGEGEGQLREKIKRAIGIDLME